MMSTGGFYAILGIFATAFLLLGAVLLAGYVLKGLAIFRLARNAGLPHPGLAWVPFAGTWLLGTLCDRSQEALGGRRRSWAVVLPVLEALASLTGSLLAGVKGYLAGILLYAGTPDTLARDYAGVILNLAFLTALTLALVWLYRDYAPGGRELLYAILSAALGSIGRGILLLIVGSRVPLSASGPPEGRTPPEETWSNKSFHSKRRGS